MKKILIIAATTFVATALHADTIYVNIVGSTAGRSAVDAQIKAILGGTGTVQMAFDATAGSSTPTSTSNATRAIYKGSFGGNDYIVRTAYGGSADGVNLVRNATAQSLINEDVALDTSASGKALTSATGLVVDAAGGASTIAHIGFSDIFPGTLGLAPTSTDEKVGVITFYWMAGKDFPASVTNITSGAARQLYSGEELPLSILSGNSADATKKVLGLGRSSSSGTRATAMAECGYGNFLPVTQWGVDVTTTLGVITGAPDRFNSATGAGLGSGGDIANILKAENGTNYLFIGYLGASDAENTAMPNARALTWNGVAFSAQNIYEGKYTFWGYLHQNHAGALSSAQELFFDELASRLKSNGGSGLLKISDMKVMRDGDGMPCYIP